MVEIAPRDAAIASRQHIVTRKGTSLWHTSYIGLNWTNAGAAADLIPSRSPAPVAYLIEQEPDSVVPVHYHGVDQFQVIVSGSGSLSNRPLTPLSIHYTNGCTPYGPLCAGPRGLAYFTLRNRSDGAAYFLPESRERLRATPHQKREVVAHHELAHATEPSIGAASPLDLIVSGADGLAASLHAVESGMKITGPDPDFGDGQYWLVLGGHLENAEGGILPPLSCLFVSPDESSYEAKAGDTGVRLLIVQFPRRETA